MSASDIPAIIRLQQKCEGRPKPVGRRPTWEESVSEMRRGVYCRSENRWWQRLVMRVVGIRGWMLTPFWGWHRCGS